MVRTVAVENFETWRVVARTLLRDDTPPTRIQWVDAAAAVDSLPLGDMAEPPGTVADQASLRIPRRFMTLARAVACHRTPDRWGLMYGVLWRLLHGEPRLLDVASDRDVHALEQRAAQVRRDDHKMRAFVRFTRLTDVDGERYVAFYRPDHRVVELVAPFFADRFASMRWSVLTPDRCAHWDLAALTYTAGVEEPERGGDSDVEQLWRTYYASIFNPARANLAATLREMPLRRWAGLPEAQLIPSLLASAHERLARLPPSHESSARAFVPDTLDLERVRAAAFSCRGCELHARATQVVFGEGRRDACLMLIGEQPGDAEDRAGRPFVGPAGEVLAHALETAGIERADLYVTNAVKHFSFEERGKRRIHKRPRAPEVRACRPWLEAELHAIRPHCIVCLGATAAQSLLGPQARVSDLRGQLLKHTSWAPVVVVTVHPSAILRADAGESYRRQLIDDLRLAKRCAAEQDSVGANEAAFRLRFNGL